MHAGHRPAHSWFLKIDSMWIVGMRVCMCVCVCVCVRVPTPRLLVTSGVIWTTYDWLNKFYTCYMATVAIIINGCGLGIDMPHENQPNNS